MPVRTMCIRARVRARAVRLIHIRIGADDPALAFAARAAEVASLFERNVDIFAGHLRQGPLLRASIVGHVDVVYAVRYMPDGNRIVTAAHDATARLWQLEPARERRVVGAA